MRISCRSIELVKRHPLAISRGTTARTRSLLVRVEQDGVEGWGEAAPVSIGWGSEDADSSARDLQRWAPLLEDCAPWEMQRVEARVDSSPGGRAARAALEMALHDWLGRRTGLPVWRLLGADLDRVPSTSLTVGILSPGEAARRARELQAAGARCLKIKMGSPKGIAADRAMLAAVRQAVGPDMALRVDANGGWCVRGCRRMIPWLAEQGVELVEQPLPAGQEARLREIGTDSPVPLFVDESCRTAEDAARLASLVHGVNLKLMKAGGIREGLRLIHTARAHGLRVMIGCMSESSLGISAAAALGAFADFLDLDSHLNLAPDPFCGLRWEEGRVLPSLDPGLGVVPAA